jgi:ribonuclease-3
VPERTAPSEEQREIEGVARLETALGYRFRRLDLLTRALSHRSLASDLAPSSPPPPNNEQLEFLGDAVLGLVVTEALLNAFPALQEGHLAVIKSRLVSASNLYRVARALDLGSHLILSRGEDRSGGREKKTLLADALEAVVAAVYLDGGLEAARDVLRRHVLDNLEDAATSDGTPDPKTALQEYAHSLKLAIPRYQVLRETGPDHRKIFTVEVRVGRDCAAIGEGASKKSASQQAASLALDQLKAQRPEA